MRAWAPPGYDVERWPTLAPCLVLVKCPARERFAEWRNNLPIAQSAENTQSSPKASFPGDGTVDAGFLLAGSNPAKEGAHAPQKFQRCPDRRDALHHGCTRPAGVGGREERRHAVSATP